MRLGIGIARRAWITPTQVLNTRPLDQLLAWAHPGRCRSAASRTSAS
jgi:hypothetical protein